MLAAGAMIIGALSIRLRFIFFFGGDEVVVVVVGDDDDDDDDDDNVEVVLLVSFFAELRVILIAGSSLALEENPLHL